MSGLAVASPPPARFRLGSRPEFREFVEAVHAEWTKLRTLAGTFWLLAAVVVLTVGLGTAAAAAVTCPAVGSVSPAIMLKIVDLPHPVLPSSASIWPDSTRRSSRSTAT